MTDFILNLLNFRWNTAIGSAAVYAPAGLFAPPHPQPESFFSDHDYFFIASADDPLTPVYLYFPHGKKFTRHKIRLLATVLGSICNVYTPLSRYDQGGWWEPAKASTYCPLKKGSKLVAHVPFPEVCTKSDGFCAENGEFCTIDDGICTEHDGFTRTRWPRPLATTTPSRCYCLITSRSCSRSRSTAARLAAHCCSSEITSRAGESPQVPPPQPDSPGTPLTDSFAQPLPQLHPPLPLNLDPQHRQRVSNVPLFPLHFTRFHSTCTHLYSLFSLILSGQCGARTVAVTSPHWVAVSGSVRTISLHFHSY